MRKIIAKQEDGKKKRTNQLLVGGILIIVMVLSTIGYSLNSGDETSTEKIEYKGIEFTRESGLWTAEINSLQFSFAYNPQETKAIDEPLNALDSYEGKVLYFYSESNDATTEIYRNLFYNNQVVQRVQNACLDGENCSGDAPIKTCDNNFIIIKTGENESITQRENCVFIEGNHNNLTKLSDAFLFKIIGVQ